MIYNKPTSQIPQEHKKDINQKILHLIETGDLQGLTHQDVYDAYSPMGALHGLEFKDFDSFHAFTEAKKQATDGQYFTPHGLCEQVVNMLQIPNTDLVADLTCGHGAFFNFLPIQQNVYGCELDSKAVRVAKFLYPKANIKCNDIRQYKSDVKFDTIILNPPFNLDFDGVSSQHYICQKASEMMKPLGILGLIVPKSYMKDEMMNKKDIEMMNENFSFLGQFELSNDAFKEMGVSNFEIKVMFFQKVSEHVEACPYVNSLHDIQYISNQVFEARQLKNKYKAKTLSEGAEYDEFNYKVKKYLYEFKAHKNLQYYVPKAEALLEKYATQAKPEKMDWKEWERVRLTEAKVLATFKRVFKNAYKVERDEIRLVKKNHSFTIKAYSSKMKHVVNKKVGTNVTEDINRLVAYDDVYDVFLKSVRVLGLDTKEFKKVIFRKKKDFILHNTPIENLSIDKKINTWLKRFRFKSQGKVCKLHDIQINDANKVLQRNHTQICWQQGVGKTVLMTSYIKYLQKYGTQKAIFITAPSLSVELTLIPFMRDNNIKFIDAKKASDLDNVKHGGIVIMSLGRVRNNKESVRLFVKKRSNKVAFIFDENDEIKNYTAKRTRAVMNAFRKCHKKLLMTGTITRNNVLESYTSFELLYNNSYNMMNNCSNMYYQDSKTKDVKRTENKRVNQPFDGYFGYADFRKCFSPSKASVFGIQKNTQDIYNSVDLKALLNRTVITRTFEEVVGKKYEFHTTYVQPNYAEKQLQDDILNKFHEMCYTYFNHTGNTRKESYLRIIRMINLLIKSTTAPHLMSEWIGQGLPTKYAKVLKMIEQRDELVMVGCVGIEATQSYYNAIKDRFPNREVFYVDGTISFKGRNDIIKKFESTSNGILVANQAALKSSVNIPTCNEVILTAFQWSWSTITQFVFRCIRFNSKEMTNVHTVLYSDSIELNILNLLMNKEKINSFMRTTDLADEEELYENFDVDSGILGSLLQKYYDEDGGMRLSWGETEIIKS